jgi:hypothetical protein
METASMAALITRAWIGFSANLETWETNVDE